MWLEFLKLFILAGSFSFLLSVTEVLTILSTPIDSVGVGSNVIFLGYFHCLRQQIWRSYELYVIINVCLCTGYRIQLLTDLKKITWKCRSWATEEVFKFRE